MKTLAKRTEHLSTCFQTPYDRLPLLSTHLDFDLISSDYVKHGSSLKQDI